MKLKETAGRFHQRHGKAYTEGSQFNVYKVGEFSERISLPPNRRGFYKISLMLQGEGILSYADKVIAVKNNVLSFANPLIPYSWDPVSEVHTGYFCMFTEEFVNHHFKTESISESPLFRVNGNSVLFPDHATMFFLSGIFEKMLQEINSTYKNKYDLLRTYIQLIIHEALKVEPSEIRYQSGTSPARITDLFLELLERQFPLTSPQQTIVLKNAGEFAGQLAIHTNHLNRSLRKITGETTTAHITRRIITEAKAMLQYGNWDIAEIAYGLGFEHSSNFYVFFKKHVGSTPHHFRKQRGANA